MEKWPSLYPCQVSGLGCCATADGVRVTWLTANGSRNRSGFRVGGLDPRQSTLHFDLGQITTLVFAPNSKPSHRCS